MRRKLITDSGIDRKNRLRILLATMLLLAGLLGYWLTRPDIYLFGFLGIDNPAPLTSDSILLYWLRNYFADIVWCLAIVQIVYLLQDLELPRYYPNTLLLMPLMSEALQAAHFIPGTFDWVDLLIYFTLIAWYLLKENHRMLDTARHLLGILAISGFAFALISSASPPKPKPIVYIDGTFSFPPTSDDLFTKPKLTRKLNTQDKELSIVLRVPTPGDNITEERKQSNSLRYNIIEKEFAKAGFVVRDRALFAKVLDQETQDYSKIGLITETDLILELLSYTLVPYKTSTYLDQNGVEQTTTAEIVFNGASVEFKLVSVKENDLVGSYTFNYTPCTEGCPHRFSTSSRARRTWKVKDDVPKDFFVNSSKRLIEELSGNN